MPKALFNSRLIGLPCLDSEELADARKKELLIPRRDARQLGVTAVKAVNAGFYVLPDGSEVMWKDFVDNARKEKVSIKPNDPLPDYFPDQSTKTLVQVTNQTTMQAALQMVQKGEKPLALNFANGYSVGGGFLGGSRAQEECLCRSSALYVTLKGDDMYKHHQRQPGPKVSSSWAILSPNVPVFRTDAGKELSEPWLLSIVTCAAPQAHKAKNAKEAEKLLKQRIRRVLEIAAAYGYTSLVLGAWGCGAFGCDPVRTARDFRESLENEFAGVFTNIVFAITDWSEERMFLGPFRDAFAPETKEQS
ncbi:Uncharacterized protein conserved in bacteria (DUF2263) [Seminavis robusta]|uniref:Uncharacterized protein conserved in bacteria (DUF2263) n=1 Tax=Seminavis robusta TaxID=568900 RepID=A0A9N8E7B9_9STRA|nr:Uncharacterized protein conserved in bacteria (DUF2263) [Seminavis robusta]|eukprot:Sro759_g198260.1 Uncharacterized protein conserved in bacteria (DUF2263) (305) ;mRNA; f:36005-36919